MQLHLLCSLSLNSILDLSDDSHDAQKQFFDDVTWETMKKSYDIKIVYVSDIRHYEKKLKKLNKHLKSMDLEKAYASARKLELDNLYSVNEIVFKIYAYM